MSSDPKSFSPLEIINELLSLEKQRMRMAHVLETVPSATGTAILLSEASRRQDELTAELLRRYTAMEAEIARLRQSALGALTDGADDD